MPTKAKICGLRDLGLLRAAAECGADLVGVVFVPGVRRRVPVEQAQEMLDTFRRERPNERPEVVGLFADQPTEEVNRVALACELDRVQLCGQEPVDYCRQISLPVTKVVHVHADREVAQETARVLREVEAYAEARASVTLDRHASTTPGGAGRAFDWAVATEVARRFPILLAGGLTPNNVAQAIHRVHPWGVDVSSGVERDGMKDRAKIAAFLESVRHADSSVPA